MISSVKVMVKMKRMTDDIKPQIEDPIKSVEK